MIMMSGEIFKIHINPENGEQLMVMILGLVISPTGEASGPLSLQQSSSLQKEGPSKRYGRRQPLHEEVRGGSVE